MKRIVPKSKIIETIFNIVAVDLVSWLTFVMMILVLVEVVARYFFRHPFGLADEISAYMLVALIFIGTAYTWRAKGHITVDIVVSRLPAKVQKRLKLVTLIIATAFVPVLIKSYYSLWANSHKYGERSGHWLRVPLEWPQLTMLIGVILLFIMMIIDLVRTIKAVRASGEEKG
ncbi:MAG: TRAP transporter small permease [Chloroflexi bacterium]|nr:TRAP transporter small permease [Chloroflexota bacterium]